ncbi:MAG: Rieske 2Fe-2S domain-containing protein [Alphaproteobacteria bacterium]|jgi:choline monooxygenase|nr:Rieske 2Fe-2S domain-containing protein [Alphaproteobacteria bacterium]MBU2042756.1 Rieske 2Fe-2S domain-containing protein [Alphaproteobacteria bacterium]MBU2126516.1 Rieske 2Fe-2S domain-containing protein [Alphaproteobacteria bacterium]MBU2208409.1 Rieske 2Fe-2S domain-containing protein [Alphaproteobacteria bacterium]MBU2290502.1 Rieske 2Fe-2S domain-containing protein [Alphaproteobacteria bacterium]
MQATLPARLYGCPDAWTRERSSVFGKAWLFLGHEAEASEPGDWIATDIAGHRLLAVRGKDGVLRAFHNVCRHRAGPLVTGASGRCDGELVCAYHGWRYALDGRLRAATGFGAAEGFDPREFGLLSLRLEVWRGLAFATMDAEAAPLADHVAPLEALLTDRGLTMPAPALRRAHDLACDWKTYAENYLEGYHIDAVHPLLAEELAGAEYRVRVEGGLVVQEVVGLNDGPQAGVWGWLWPNLGINVYRDGAMMERITPIGPGRTRLDYLFLSDDGEAALGEALVASDRLTAEDAVICEAVQANLSAGAYDRGVLSPNHEVALAWFQSRIAEVHP